ncbi:MAG TPA: VanZ family protein [Candidatus Coprovivens excrementavium]|nr:VanZ family protein [Candidatus Coprovivens excrementavium]
MTNLSPFYETFYWAINNTWPMLTLFGIIMLSLKLTKVIINKDHFTFYKEFYNFLFIIYILLLYYLLLSTEKAASGINLIPFKEMTRYNIGTELFFYNVVGNIVLFIPFGYFVSDYLKAKKIHHILIVSILISLTAETIQYKIGRAFDVDDIILNVIGAILGFMFYISIQAIKNHLPKFLQNNIFYNILAIFVLIIIILLFGSIWGVNL